jgi:para-nitrobenzyl esterase
MTKRRRCAAFVGGLVLAVATPPAGAQVSDSPLSGTSWRLVKLQGGDDTTLAPEDRDSYTLEFGKGARLVARIDCNRGLGTWKSPGPSQLELSPLALTRAMCSPRSLHDRILKDWSLVRSFVLKDGHLFLSLQADAGTYEFEPAVTTR